MSKKVVSADLVSETVKDLVDVPLEDARVIYVIKERRLKLLLVYDFQRQSNKIQTRTFL